MNIYIADGGGDGHHTGQNKCGLCLDSRESSCLPLADSSCFRLAGTLRNSVSGLAQFTGAALCEPHVVEAVDTLELFVAIDGVLDAAVDQRRAARAQEE